MTSNPHGPVVIGFDGSVEATRAAEYGAWEAARRRVPLRLVYAHQPTPMWGPASVVVDEYVWEQDWVRELLTKAKKEVTAAHPGVTVEAVAINSGAAGALVEESKTASLVVVGTRATGGLVGHLSGSVAAQVAAHASSPVVAMRSTAESDADPAGFMGRPVVVGVDGSEESDRAMAFAAEEAVARKTDLHAVFVWSVLQVHDIGPIRPETFAEPEERAKAERLLAEATSGWSDQYPELTIVRRAVHDLDIVSALAREGNSAGLIVVGSRGHGGFLGLRLGSTVDGLIRYAPVPVAVIRGE